MVEMARIRDGVLEYATERQFVAGTALGLVAARADALTRALAENELVKASGLVTENGMVDLDTMYDAALNQMKRQKTLSLDIPMMGRMTFNEEDLAELYRTIVAR